MRFCYYADKNLPKLKNKQYADFKIETSEWRALELILEVLAVCHSLAADMIRWPSNKFRNLERPRLPICRRLRPPYESNTRPWLPACKVDNVFKGCEVLSYLQSHYCRPWEAGQMAPQDLEMWNLLYMSQYVTLLHVPPQQWLNNFQSFIQAWKTYTAKLHDCLTSAVRAKKVLKKLYVLVILWHFISHFFVISLTNITFHQKRLQLPVLMKMLWDLCHSHFLAMALILSCHSCLSPHHKSHPHQHLTLARSWPTILVPFVSQVLLNL